MRDIVAAVEKGIREINRGNYDRNGERIEDPFAFESVRKLSNIVAHNIKIMEEEKC